jgi:hypothetical protein
MDIIIPPELRNRVFVYLDDLLLLSENFSDHIDLLKRIAIVLRNAGLTLNIKKCKWCVKELRYLGYIIGDGCLKPDPEKIAAITNMTEPKSVRQVRSILGLVGWYRRFISNFAELTAPLTELTKKSKSFHFTDEARNAFNLIKEKLTTAPILTTPDYSKPFIIACDASQIGVGGVLSQLDENGSEKPIAYFSKKLNKAQQNYSITKLECLAAILSVEKFREYVVGLEFTVITDHASLKWLMGQTDLNGRLARWALKLQGYNFQIQHRRGNLNVVPDTLSRIFPENV